MRRNWHIQPGIVSFFVPYENDSGLQLFPERREHSYFSMLAMIESARGSFRSAS